jgi:SPP1 gp7 family putative phage head morphogenesis protein
MPTRFADVVADRFAFHEVNLARLEAGHQQRLLQALRKLEADLVKQIERAGADGRSFTVTRSKALLAETRSVIQSHYQGVYELHRDQLIDLGLYEAKESSQLVNRRLGVRLLAVGVPESVIESMLKDNIVLGVPLKSFWERQAGGLQEAFTRELRSAVFAGETTNQVIRRVRGTAAAKYKDGIMETSRRGADAVVRTSAQSILNDARMKVYQANKDVIEGVQAQVTLDNRTSAICMARSGFAWDLDGKPLPGTETDEDFPGPPPWHPNCRSTLIPIMRSIGEIVEDPDVDRKVREVAEDVPRATQSSMDGQVAQTLTYEDWLKTKSEAFQKEVLGPGKWELWQKGEIGLKDLTDQRGRSLTLEQLKAMDEES